MEYLSLKIEELSGSIANGGKYLTEATINCKMGGHATGQMGQMDR